MEVMPNCSWPESCVLLPGALPGIDVRLEAVPELGHSPSGESSVYDGGLMAMCAVLCLLPSAIPGHKSRS
jgi:hypothetical protein